MANGLIFPYCLEGWYRGTEQATWTRVGLSGALGKAGNAYWQNKKCQERSREGRSRRNRKTLQATGGSDDLRPGDLHSSSYSQEKLELLYTF